MFSVLQNTGCTLLHHLAGLSEPLTFIKIALKMWCGCQNEPQDPHLRAQFGGNVMDLLLDLGYC